MLERTTDLYKWDFDLMAAGFWMKISNEEPAKPVRVFVSYEALRAIDPYQVADRYGAIATLEANRQHIDDAASAKFDAGGIEGGLHEGFPVVILHATDMA